MYLQTAMGQCEKEGFLVNSNLKLNKNKNIRSKHKIGKIAFRLFSATPARKKCIISIKSMKFITYRHKRGKRG